MTIAATDREIKGLIDDHHVYGAETVINALVRASANQPYLNEEAMIILVKNAFERLKEY